jgi:hypothetical protein
MRFRDLAINFVPPDMVVLQNWKKDICLLPTIRYCPLASGVRERYLACQANSRLEFEMVNDCGVSEMDWDWERPVDEPILARQRMAARNLEMLRQDLLARLDEIDAAKQLLNV